MPFTQEDFEKSKFELLMILEVFIGKIPGTPFCRLSPISQRLLRDTLLEYVSSLPDDESKYEVIMKDFEKYFSDGSSAVENMKTIPEYQTDYDWDSLLTCSFCRPMYPTKTRFFP